MEVITPDAEPGCGYGCIGVCVAMCFIPPLYMVAISDDIAWSGILANPQEQ